MVVVESGGVDIENALELVKNSTVKTATIRIQFFIELNFVLPVKYKSYAKEKKNCLNTSLFFF
jgi:hypothetical protein